MTAPRRDDGARARGGAGDEAARLLGVGTASLAIVASMIGTGVYTTSGLLLDSLRSPAEVLVVWCVGGVIALAGAVSYAELGAMFPKNGGEALLLGRVYHPLAGFVAGFVGMTVGFAAPIAACAYGFGRYVHAALPALPVVPVAAGVVVVLGAIALGPVRWGARAQNALTVAKLVVAAALAIAGLSSTSTATPDAPLGTAIRLDGAFAVALVYVTYSYSGWNAAAYIAGEVRDAPRTLPRALVAGTAAVTVLYVLLNAFFLTAAPADALRGVEHVAHVAAEHRWGAAGASVVTGLVGFGLLSAISAFLMAGARILETLAASAPALARLDVRNAAGAPAAGIALQVGLGLVLLATTTFDTLVGWVGAALTLSSAATVAGVVVLRIREPERVRPFRTPLYPLAPLAFVAVSAWMMVHAAIERPLVVGATLGTLGLGAVLGVVAGAHRQR